MATEQITLTEAESETLRALSQRIGKTQEELLREAVGQLFARLQQQDRHALLRQARGIWKDRHDLPAPEDIMHPYGSNSALYK
jgi:hypothetical protein